MWNIFLAFIILLCIICIGIIATLLTLKGILLPTWLMRRGKRNWKFNWQNYRLKKLKYWLLSSKSSKRKYLRKTFKNPTKFFFYTLLLMLISIGLGIVLKELGWKCEPFLLKGIIYLCLLIMSIIAIIGLFISSLKR